MTRKECEKKISDLMLEIVKVYHQYNPDGRYLALQYNSCDDEDLRDFIQFNNKCWPAMDEDLAGEDFDAPIEWNSLKKEVSA